MAQASASGDPAKLLAQRLVRYEELRPCTTAFIDTRTPGSAQKENFTIIGPGVAENPDQHVHISIPHGFNIGAARQPPDCVNSQHSHETAEVFVIHSGHWEFLLGPNGEDGKVRLSAGDTISIPVHVFRGFKNVGDTVGIMFAVLGGDDPGHVTWAPYVFDAARKYGLVLMEDGSLVDTTRGDTVPDGKKPMPPTSAQDVARARRMSARELLDCVVSHTELRPPGAGVAGLNECPIIGAASPGEGLPAGKMAWPHGFHFRSITVEPAGSTARHLRREEEVILMHEGRLSVTLGNVQTVLAPGDTLTIPIGMQRSFSNPDSSAAHAFVVRGGDHPKPAEAVKPGS